MLGKKGVYPGEVAYDRNCRDVGGGLTGCNAGIRTQEFGLVDFYYEHDMDAKPCLAPLRKWSWWSGETRHSSRESADCSK
ncbi:hypothetical protein AKJ41_03800 [candidate division MSBL1 archaeon SCGC-AAA259O05]|uniref:Uncharacterized protein n=1 Tax=candidate division MSBL1 archaeon SCGC-AAA259O05 TaxID=1698271 RepID=A0A133V2P8_9EURY|nr:hypothetical protein AKJ41_03800 [candidate division MSBL1 archaeon SCGC-AAA259O05]